MSLNKNSTFLEWNSIVTSSIMMNLEYYKQNNMAGRLLENNHCETTIHKINHTAFIHYAD